MIEAQTKGVASIALKSELDFESGSLIQQLANLMRDAIRNKELKTEDRIPPTRKFADELGVSRGTVSTAIEILMAEGLLESKIGSGVFVSRDAQYIQDEQNKIAGSFISPLKNGIIPDTDDIRDCAFDFRPCRPATDLFPRGVWKQCFTKASSIIPAPDYGDPRGDLQLREAIAGYLQRSRGLTASAEEIIITNGAVHAMHLLASLYLDKDSKIIVENPGYTLARQTFQVAGATVLTCGVDEDGLIVDALPKDAKDIQIVYVTPSHQFPIGSRLSLGRRRTLLDWAQRNRVIVVEDDYDGEFRFDVPPLAPLASMDNNCVYYCGTFSKILFPGIRVGYAVAPKPLIDKLASHRLLTEYAPNDITQTALYHFIAEGHFEKHILRMRREYATKRIAVTEALCEYLPDCSLSGLHSGLHGVVEMNGAGSRAKDVAARAEQNGILIPPIERYNFRGKLKRNALVLGYAAHTTEEIRKGIQLLGSLL